MRLVVGRGTPLAELREEIEAAEVPLERIVVRPGSAAEEDHVSPLRRVLSRISGRRHRRRAAQRQSILVC